MRKNTIKKYREIFCCLSEIDFSKEFSLRQFCYEHSISDAARKAICEAHILLLKNRKKNGSIYVFNPYNLTHEVLFETFIVKFEELIKYQKKPDQKIFVEFNITTGEVKFKKNITAEISSIKKMSLEFKLKNLFLKLL